MTNDWVVSLDYFLRGAAAMSCVMAGLFFLRYWRATRDRLFLFFLAAFFAFALNWTGLAAVQSSEESTHWLYLLRLVAFVLIIAAIVDKNRRPGPPV